jgi:hypothetical protein
MPNAILIVRNPGVGPVTAQAVLGGLSNAQQALTREDSEVDTAPFAAQVEQGDWGGQDRALASMASELQARATKLGDSEIHYFGFAEIPHMIALGAFIGDERPVELHDYDRDSKVWVWPNDRPPLQMRIVGLPTGEPITAEGSVILRVEVSFATSDADVHQAAGSKHLADVRVVVGEGLTPSTTIVRSPVDVQNARLKIREALAAIRTKFPNLETLHVFAAVPASVAFALGQELKPRNSPPIQTYRYRKVDGQPAYRPAIELSGRLSTATEAPLTDVQRDIARRTRNDWQATLTNIEAYVSAKQKQFPDSENTRWYQMLEPRRELEEVKPFPALALISKVVHPGAKVADTPVPSEYSLTTHDNVWHLSDQLLIAFQAATQGDEERLRHLVRLFLFHESLHEHHSLTKLRAPGVGAFPNCLEFIDYTADAYALLHQLDYQRVQSAASVDTPEKQLIFLRTELKLVLDSFWAFEPAAPIVEWQVRRIRRYMNWYWRLAQLEQARDVITAVRLLARPPHVELVGVHQFARGTRVFCRIDDKSITPPLELGLVLENVKLLRLTETSRENLKQLLASFQSRDGDGILKFFRLVYEEAKDKGGALPLY